MTIDARAPKSYSRMIDYLRGATGSLREARRMRAEFSNRYPHLMDRDRSAWRSLSGAPVHSRRGCPG